MGEAPGRRLVGVMRICDGFAGFCHLAIEPMSRACDAVCFLTDRVKDPSVRAAMEACPNLVGIREQSGPGWNHGRTMVEAYRFAQEFKPDWVVAADYDEILPYSHLEEDLAAAAKAGKRCVAYAILHCWESPERIVDPKLNVQGPHAKLYVGGDPDFGPDSDGGFCVPRGWWKQIHYSRYPMRHLRMMTPDLRARRASSKRFVDPWSHAEPKTHDYRDLPFADWRKL